MHRKILAVAAAATAIGLTGCTPTSILTTLNHGPINVGADVTWNIDMGGVLDSNDEARMHADCDDMGGSFVYVGANGYCLDVDH